MSRVAIVGGGAAGLMVAGFLSQNHDVVVYDKNEKVGKKLNITGKGRCNITNLCMVEDFLKNVVRGDKFLKTALYSFDSYACVDFFENLGLATKVERGDRVFPQSDKAYDVVCALRDVHCKDVNFCLNTKVLAITKKEDGFVVVTDKGKQIFDKVIIATGGASYKGTGSDGDGYKFAKIFGHSVEEIKPALCPLVIEDWFVGALQGVSLKNVQLNVEYDGKKHGEFGEMLFTDKGISGPIVLTVSSLINRANQIKMSLDFKPALSEQQLDARLLRDFEENKNKELKNVLKLLLPKAVADIFAKAIGLDENKKINNITKAERLAILQGLKKFPLKFAGFYDIDAAIVTSGGVSTKEINPKTFESKLVEGLYLLGEVLDVDAFTGGFNLQIAWASAYSCAKNFG